MRSCEEMEVLMNLSLDDMLTSEEQQMLQAHLAACPACRTHMEELCALKKMLGQMEEAAPEDLHERILAYVEQETGNTQKTIPFHQRRWVKMLSGIAACAVLVVAAARFVPALDLSGNGMNNTSAIEQAATALPVAPPKLDSDMAAPEAVPDAAAPGHGVVVAPQEPSAAPEYMMPGNTGEGTTNAVTGQMAEDLPPLRKEYLDENNDYRVATVRKWLKVIGPKTALPDWVDLKFIYEAELEGESREYVEIAEWAEEYWVDQLIACGFTVEVMEEQEIVEDGEHILLIFFWE